MTDAPSPAPASPDRLEQARLEKLAKIEALGHDPWGQRFDGHITIREARAKAPADTGVDADLVRVAGRVMLKNDKGKLKFAHIQDATGRIQLMASKADVSEEVWSLLECVDLGDLVGVDGPVRRTKTGEITVFVQSFTVLTKSLAQPPEKFHGAKDTEMLLRQRYVDLIYNDGVLARLLKRSTVIDSVRQTLRARSFHEVETPVLHAIAGGAAARPFITHHNTLDIDLYLRIALELHLKRLMVGGIERVYEIGRVFRNEGIDATHNPEFTMIEIYQAYGNYESMMDLTEAIIVDALDRIHESDYVKITNPGPTEFRVDELVRRETVTAANDLLTKDAQRTRTEPRLAAFVDHKLPPRTIPWGRSETLNLAPPWPRKKYADLFLEHAGCDMRDAAAVQKKARDLIAHKHLGEELLPLIEQGKIHPDVLVNDVFEATVEHVLSGPVFVMDYPASICPLTKRKRSDPHIAERFELYIAGMEVANAYTELNDPRLQEDLFRTQLAGLSEEDSMAKMDHDFIRALKVGMPPAGGLGIGIDRLVMLLTNTQTIRDVIFFPLLRPEAGAHHPG
ncbi:MAG: lysine--tRNA ligase [Planctomycetaceae bacterium]|nr:lysine--tRNA ligase [Planctomycetaceae bacterium]